MCIRDRERTFQGQTHLRVGPRRDVDPGRDVGPGCGVGPGRDVGPGRGVGLSDASGGDELRFRG
eukprot:3736096-Pleurochrysis_carterae.AAC.1